MNDQARGIALIIGVFLSIPSIEKALSDELPVEQLVLRMAIALSLSLAGMTLLFALVRTYQADDDGREVRRPGEPGYHPSGPGVPPPGWQGDGSWQSGAYPGAGQPGSQEEPRQQG